MNTNIEIYVDGACNNKTKVGAWSYVILSDKGIIKKCGSRKNTTNNAMELEAVCQALSECNEGGIMIYSDSAYVVNTIIRGVMDEWKRNRWKSKKGRYVRNKKGWKQLYSLLQNKNMDVRFVKIKGHSGNEYNIMVDHLAKEAVKDSNVCTGKNRK